MDKLIQIYKSTTKLFACDLTNKLRRKWKETIKKGWVFSHDCIGGVNINTVGKSGYSEVIIGTQSNFLIWEILTPKYGVTTVLMTKGLHNKT